MNSSDLLGRRGAQVWSWSRDFWWTWHSYSHWNMTSSKKQNRMQAMSCSSSQQGPASQCHSCPCRRASAVWLHSSEPLPAGPTGTRQPFSALTQFNLWNQMVKERSWHRGVVVIIPMRYRSFFLTMNERITLRNYWGSSFIHIQTDTIEHYSCHKGLFNQKTVRVQEPTNTGSESFQGR